MHVREAWSIKMCTNFKLKFTQAKIHLGKCTPKIHLGENFIMSRKQFCLVIPWHSHNAEIVIVVF